MSTLAAAALLAGLAAAQSPALSLEEYAARLDELSLALDAGRIPEARGLARALRDRDVTWNGESLATERALLREAESALGARRAKELARRAGRLAAALREPRATAAGPEPDRALLERLRPHDPLAPGGDVPRFELEPPTLPERVGAWFWGAVDWIGEKWRRLQEWLDSLRPESVRTQADAPGRTAVVAAAFAVAVVVLLGWLVWRGRRGRLAEPEAGPPLSRAESERDADPLSREAAGWERRAADLASAGRFREAVRAWYHAVLVALFQTGRLHYQKGRTNWEYAARLDPAVGWRPAFNELTRLFDREWYGRRSSDAAALEECARQAREILDALRHGRAA